jgi:hypothetical protein
MMELPHRDQLYFANISVCVFDEQMAGFYLDGKFMEPRSDDSLQKLTKNLEKQRAGSVRRSIDAYMVFMGSDMYGEYALKKARLCQDASTESRRAGLAQLQSLTSSLKRFLDERCLVCATYRTCSYRP